MEVTVDPDRMASLGRALVQMGERGIQFYSVFLRRGRHGLELCFLIQNDWVRLAVEHLEQPLRQDVEAFDYRTAPADLVFFQGPHFGDRYGIADAAVGALSNRGIAITAIVCSGACIYIVLPEGKSEEAVLVLAEAFEVPKVLLRRSPKGSQTDP